MNYRNSIFTICCLVTTLSFAQTNSYKNVFALPVFGGMIDAKASCDGLIQNDYDSPFSRRIRVFKTEDGSPVDPNSVIDFYDDFYRQRGWIDGISERKGDEPYLTLRIHGGKGQNETSFIQYAGDLYLWVAPKDGMITVYMGIWRNSGLGQSASDTLRKTEKALQTTGSEMGYRISSGWSPGWLNESYRNEYFIEIKQYTLNRNSYPQGEGLSHCLGSRGKIRVTFLAYKDAAVASEVAQELESEHGVRELGILRKNMRSIPADVDIDTHKFYSRGQKKVLQKDFMVILISTSGISPQTNEVAQIVDAIQNME